jgi:hypothetical protein
MDGNVLVDARNGARQVASLAMKCDSKEIPLAASGAKPEGWWLVEGCMFAGSATPGGEKGTLDKPVLARIEGTAALAVVEERLIGIVSPNSAGEPALWWSWPLSTIKVETVGTQGLFKKRPASIRLDRDGGVDADSDTLALKGVVRLFRNSGRAQPGQEESLLKALRG